MEWVHCHIARKPVPPSERLEGIPAPVSAIVMKLYLTANPAAGLVRGGRSRASIAPQRMLPPLQPRIARARARRRSRLYFGCNSAPLCGNDHDFDEAIGIGELRFDGGARRRRALRRPTAAIKPANRRRYFVQSVLSSAVFWSSLRSRSGNGTDLPAA
jgi:hypothetical protein